MNRIGTENRAIDTHIKMNKIDSESRPTSEWLQDFYQRLKKKKWASCTFFSDPVLLSFQT